MNKDNRSLDKFVLWALVALFFLMPENVAFAQQKLGDMVKNTYDAFLPIQNFLSAIFYIIGAFFIITGLNMARQYVSAPDDNPLKNVIMRFAGGGFLISAPYAAKVLIETIRGDGGGAASYSLEATKAVTSDGMDQAIVNLADSLWEPMINFALPFFCYVAGLIFMFLGLKRLALASNDGPDAPSSKSTFAVFFLAAALLSIGYVMNTIQGTLFGADGGLIQGLDDTSLISNLSADQTVKDKTFNVLWGVFTMLRIFGYISFIRGLFLIKGAMEGAQGASLMAASTHIIAGAMLANIIAFIGIIETTFISDCGDYIFSSC